LLNVGDPYLDESAQSAALKFRNIEALRRSCFVLESVKRSIRLSFGPRESFRRAGAG